MKEKESDGGDDDGEEEEEDQDLSREGLDACDSMQ